MKISKTLWIVGIAILGVLVAVEAVVIGVLISLL